MNYQIFCFSPTGNTKFLAESLAKKLDSEIVYDVNKIKCDHLIIMASIHAFSMPKFLSKIINNCNKLSIIAVGCNKSKINDAAGLHIIKRANKLNKKVIVYKILEMPLTIVKKFDFDYGNEILEESLKKIETISNDIINENKNLYKISILSRILYKFHYLENVLVKLFGLELFPNKSCIKCGICVKNCPKKNIKLNKKIKFGLKCMLCMNCIYKCPKKAIHPRISKFLELKNGYDLEDYLKK